MAHNSLSAPLPPPAVDTAAGASAGDDHRLAQLLAAIWAARTGRALPPGPVSELSLEELIDFWCENAIAAPEPAARK